MEVKERRQKIRTIWRAKHRDYRGGKAGEERILMLVPGQGTCSVLLSSLPDEEIDKLYAESVGWVNGRKVQAQC